MNDNWILNGGMSDEDFDRMMEMGDTTFECCNCGCKGLAEDEFYWNPTDKEYTCDECYNEPMPEDRGC